MERFVKMFEIDEKGIKETKLVSRDESENLRGKLIILKPEESEIAKNLGVKEKGVFGARFK